MTNENSKINAKVVNLTFLQPYNLTERQILKSILGFAVL